MTGQPNSKNRPAIMVYAHCQLVNEPRYLVGSLAELYPLWSIEVFSNGVDLMDNLVLIVH